MKLMKKVTAALLAGVCLAGAAVPVATEAAKEAAYELGDANHDGVVDLLDVVCINKYLYGAIKLKEIDSLDINQNLVVEASDAYCLLNKLLNNTYSGSYLSIKGKSVDFPLDTKGYAYYFSQESGSRTYRRYSYTDKKELSTYTLSLSEAGVTASDASTNKIIDGTDSRIVARGEESTGIVRLKEAGGSGFIVGNHVIATAAHCVYSNGFIPTITIQTYDTNGQLTNKTLTAMEAHIPSNYVALKDEYFNEYDYALIYVKEDLSDYTHFSLGTTYNLTEYYYNQVPLYVTGCPGYDEETGFKNEDNMLYTDEGRADGEPNDFFVLHNIDTSGGQSGSPIYTITKNVVNNSEITYQYTAIAIHTSGLKSYGFNWGTRITRYQLQFYYDNSSFNNSGVTK